jgi:hypothetical protein
MFGASPKVKEKSHERKLPLHPTDLKPEEFGTEVLPYHRLPRLQKVKQSKRVKIRSQM